MPRALWLLLLLALLAAGCSGDGSEPQNPRVGTATPELKVRKDARDLTAEEKRVLVDAILRLKASPSPLDRTLNYYDQFVWIHHRATQLEGELGYGVAHMSPAFLPWHRKLLMLYEEALSEVAGRPISLPYWDWTNPESTAAVFSDDLMGPGGTRANGFALTEGPFRREQWRLSILPEGEDGPLNPEPWLVRALGVNDGALIPDPLALPDPVDVLSALNVPVYDVAPFGRASAVAGSFRNNVEGFTPPAFQQRRMHNVVHLWVGGLPTMDGEPRAGTMALVPTSVNDPAFFLHHCNVDRLFDAWLLQHPGGYLPVEGGQKGWNLHDEMPPFDQLRSNPRVARHGLTPADMMSSELLGYGYDRLPVAAPVRAACACAGPDCECGTAARCQPGIACKKVECECSGACAHPCKCGHCGRHTLF